MPTAEELKDRIEASIPGSTAQVRDTTGTGDHFEATVESTSFEGTSRIDQHRAVYAVFGDDIGGAIHALALTTRTP